MVNWYRDDICFNTMVKIMKPTDRISKHFTYAEVIHSALAENIGMNNEPPAELLPKVQQMADMILENVRAHFNKPIIITSWWRCPALNQMISNNPDSQHPKAEAVDFTVKDIPNIDVCKYIQKYLVFDQLILERSWIHCSFINEGNRKEVLTCYDGRTYKKGLSCSVKI